MAEAIQLTTPEAWEKLWKGPGAFLVFKHSTTCPISAEAHREFQAWCEGVAQGGLSVYWVRVIEERPLSQRIAADTGVPHQSPQAILVRDGKVAWHGSHWAITRDSLAAAVADPAAVESHSTSLLVAKQEHQASLTTAKP